MAINTSRILVPVNGDSTGEDAFRLACRLSRESKAKLYALYIIEVEQRLPLDAMVDSSQGEAVLRRIEAVGQEEKCKVEAEFLQARHPGPAIVQEAKERGIGLIVLGIPYKRRFGQFTVGRAAYYVLRNAPCPVIVWREHATHLSQLGS